MARRVYDVDASTPDEMAVRFRGVEYVLGESVLGVVEALKLARSIGDKPEDEERVLGDVIRHLSPALADASADAVVGERLALRAAVTAYVGSLGRLTFRAEG